MSESSVGKDLKPTKKQVDQFGQVNSIDLDFTTGNVPTAQESVRAHSSSDVDASRNSQHHTLGKGHSQAAPGNHVHDGINGAKLGLYQMDPAGGKKITSLTLTGSKGGNVALANLIALLKNFIDLTDNTT